MKLKSLKTIKTEERINEFTHPEHENFKVELRYLSRLDEEALNKACLVDGWENHQPVKKPDVDLFVRNYVKKVFIGWTGLTPEIVAEFVAIDIEALKAELKEAKLKEIPFDFDTAYMLVRHSGDFDGWINTCRSNLRNFQNAKKKEAEGNLTTG